jgi:hypothetical protein
MKARLTLLAAFLLALSPGCTDDRIDQDEQRSASAGDPTIASGHNTRCTNTSPQPCPCNTTADCPDGFYCQAADSTPLYGYCFVKPTCNAGDPNCSDPGPGCNADDPYCD